MKFSTDDNGIVNLSWKIKSKKQRTAVKPSSKNGTLSLLVGIWISVATMENSMEVSQKHKNRTIIWPSIVLQGI